MKYLGSITDPKDIVNKEYVDNLDTSVRSDFEDVVEEIADALDAKQDTLVSGTNIKTINNNSLLGSGNISIGGGGGLTIDDIYPIGSIYMSVNGTDPGTLFAGTYWTRIKDTFLLASGDDYAADDGTHTTAIGGEAEHILSASESGVPKHSHTYTRPTVVTGGGGHTHTVSSDYKTIKVGTSTNQTIWHNDGTSSGNISPGIAANTGTHSHTLTGGGVADNTAASAATAHNNMPPYLPIYVWKRVAPPS